MTGGRGSEAWANRRSGHVLEAGDRLLGGDGADDKQDREHEHDGCNAFESNGLAHLRLAREERPLFHFLYLSPHMEATGFKDVYESVAIDGVQACIEELGNLSPEAARELYLDMIVYVHGMAAMLATGAQLSDEELRERMDRAFRGFVALVRA